MSVKSAAVVDSLMSRTLAWESERKKPFLYDGARLVAVLEEHKQARLRQEEERRRLRVSKTPLRPYRFTRILNDEPGSGDFHGAGAEEAAHPAEREGGDAAPEAARQQLRQGGRALQSEPETG